MADREESEAEPPSTPHLGEQIACDEAQGDRKLQPPPLPQPSSVTSPPPVLAESTPKAGDSADVEIAPPPPQADLAASEREIVATQPPSTPSAKSRKPRLSRVTFTDGRKIVRHTDGTIEVPRVFSCAGAGIKPFWVYGTHPEREAEKERKARHEWRMLCDQAL